MAVPMFFKDRNTNQLVGSSIIPSWLWNAVKTKAREDKVSENTVVKNALKNYLAQYRNKSIENIHNERGEM